MTILKWLILCSVLLYVALTGAMYLLQRQLMYFPDERPVLPAAVTGVPAFEAVEIPTDDGEILRAWHLKPREGLPVVLYFQGNAGGLQLRADRFMRLAAAGFGVVALGYRGYGGSTGSPTETGLLLDAAAAYRFASEKYGADRVAVWGESLGTGVAVALAARQKVARVVLEAPYTSTADVAASLWWFLPVRTLMTDQFRSDQRIVDVTAPLLIVHGEADGVVPFGFGERLFGLARDPKTFLPLPGVGHAAASDPRGMQAILDFLRGQG